MSISCSVPSKVSRHLEQMDVSGTVVDASGSVVDSVVVPVVDPSGSVVDASGSVIDPSGSVIDPSGSVVDVSGSVVDVSGSVLLPGPIYLSDLSGGTPPPPRILLTEILSNLAVLQQQEASDRAAFAFSATPNLEDIRNKLTAWIAGGKQGLCDLARVSMTPPNVCSDGVSRNFFDYIQFVSGKTLAEHVHVLQDILPEFEVGYRCSRTELVFCVIRVMV